MKRKAFKFIGIVAMIAIIGFTVTACNNSTSPNDTPSNGGGTGGFEFQNISTPSGDGYTVVNFTGDATEVVIPATHNGRPVIMISGGSAGAFEGNENIISVTIPTSVAYIVNRAFRNTPNLHSITIPSSVVEIENNAFEGSGITSITFGEGIQLSTISSNVFADTANLEGITIPASVTFISSGAFQDSAIKSITFTADSNLSRIEFSAFRNATNLESITIPESVDFVGAEAFGGWTAQQTIHIPFATLAEAVNQANPVWWHPVWRNDSNAVIMNNAGVQIWPVNN